MSRHCRFRPSPPLILEIDIGERLPVVVADDRKHHSVTAITELNDRVVWFVALLRIRLFPH
jgi:hypothetical protein